MHLCGCGQQNICMLMMPFLMYAAFSYIVYTIMILISITCLEIVSNCPTVQRQPCVGGLVRTAMTDKPQHGLWWGALIENHSHNIAIFTLDTCISLSTSIFHVNFMIFSSSLFWARMPFLTYSLYLSSFYPPTRVPGSPFHTVPSVSKDRYEVERGDLIGA